MSRWQNDTLLIGLVISAGAKLVKDCRYVVIREATRQAMPESAGPGFPACHQNTGAAVFHRGRLHGADGQDKLSWLAAHTADSCQPGNGR